MSSSSNNNNDDDDGNNNTCTGLLETRLRTALWCFFAGDALASPTHWYYGGYRQIQGDYGPQGIVDYTKPVYHLPGSILNKSNVNGGGRATNASFHHHRDDKKKTTIVGDVILHGKLALWQHPSQQIHYHATLQAGETTLEATLGRVLMRSLIATQGVFDANHFRQAYMDFMQTPGSHNDTYASTCHRMFFANLVLHGKSPEHCPDNDDHNVNTMDGLVLPTLVSLVTAARHDDVTIQDVAQAAADCVAVTRQSTVLPHKAAAWGKFLARALWRSTSNNDSGLNDDDIDNDNIDKKSSFSLFMANNIQQLAQDAQLPTPPRSRNTLTACYLDSALPALVDALLLWHDVPVWDALLANANTGGENVHRGSCLGAALGLYANNNNNNVPDHLRTGLYHYHELAAEIDALVKVVLPPKHKKEETEKPKSMK